MREPIGIIKFWYDVLRDRAPSMYTSLGNVPAKILTRVCVLQASGGHNPFAYPIKK